MTTLEITKYQVGDNFMKDLWSLKAGKLIWVLKGAHIFPCSKWGYRKSSKNPRTNRLSIIPTSVVGDTWHLKDDEVATFHERLRHYMVEENSLAMVVMVEPYMSGGDFKIELLLNDTVYLVWGASLKFKFISDHTIEALEKALEDTDSTL